MLIGLDAIPLTEARAGVGHYTFELARALTVHDLSLRLHPETHERRRVRRARRRLPLMARSVDAVLTPTESVRREVCERLRVAPSKVFAVHEAAREFFRPLRFEETEEA